MNMTNQTEDLLKSQVPFFILINSWNYTTLYGRQRAELSANFVQIVLILFLLINISYLMARLRYSIIEAQFLEVFFYFYLIVLICCNWALQTPSHGSSQSTPSPKKLHNTKKNQAELNTTEIKNTIEGINTGLDDSKEQISNLEDRVVEITEAKQKKE